MEDPWAVQWYYPIIEQLATFLGKNTGDNNATKYKKLASTERQYFLAVYHGRFKGCAMTLTHNWTTSHFSTQMEFQQQWFYVLKISVNRASTIFGLVSWNI